MILSLVFGDDIFTAPILNQKSLESEGFYNIYIYISWSAFTLRTQL